jgi:Spy/CpxP family protein refolding chaperone
MMKNWKPMTVTFLGGLLIGGVLGRSLSPWFFLNRMSPEKRMERKLDHFSRKLDLTRKQKEEVRVIFQTKSAQMKNLVAENQPKFEAVRKTAADDIRKILTPDQLVKFEAFHSKMEAKRKKNRPSVPF